MTEILETQAKGNDSKALKKSKRNAGLIPVNIYGPDIESSYSYYMDEIMLNRAIKSGDKVHKIKTDRGEFDVIFREIQRHPVTWKLTHVDMLVLTPDKKITLKIPLKYVGVPVGVKDMGGVFVINSRFIMVEAFPRDIPNQITIDVEPLKIKETVHASDIERDKLRVVSDGDLLLASVGITRAAVAEGEDEEGEEGVEGEEGAEGEEGEGEGTGDKGSEETSEEQK